MADKFEEFAVLEIMGHQRYAGRVTEQSIAGTGFIRIDVPQVNGFPAFTKLFGPGSVYCISPCSEEVALAMATKFRQEPIQRYELPEELQKRLPMDVHKDYDSIYDR